MDPYKIRALLETVQRGETDVDTALEQLRALPYTDVGDFARLDTHRALRNGLPETVFCQGKTPEQVAAIMERLWSAHERVMGTRVVPEMADFVRARLPEARYDATSRLLTLERGARPALPADAPYAMVVCAGTADLPVAEEAAQTLAFAGQRVERAYDVGVAGLHRLLGELPRLQAATVVITVAGMEGALASVVGGLVAAPLVAVPTSVGYGASFHGLSALLTMLNSCAAGVAVVNIDNGFGAAIFAHAVLRSITR